MSGDDEIVTLATVADKIDQLIDAVGVGTEAVREERRGRRLSIGLVVAAMVLVSVFGFRYVDSRSVTCETRSKGREDTRSAISAAVDEVGRYADLSPQERTDLNRRVAKAVLEELPAPDC